MGKLQEYYRLFDMFKGKLNDDQKKILEGLEDQLIAEEILPAISESVAPVLEVLRRKLALVVDYDPEGGITVKTTRGEVVVKEKNTKKYEIPKTKKTIKVSEKDDKPIIKRSPATGLCVWTSDTEFIQENKAAYTMVQVVELIGVDLVVALNIPHDGDKLVSRVKHPKYSGSQHALTGGYLLNTHSDTEKKKKQLEKIFKALRLDWRVEIVK